MPDTPLKPRPPALDPATVALRPGAYPPPFDKMIAGREKHPLGDALGLKNYGVNLVRLKPGARSAMRHWHTLQDEFVWIVEGELVLVTDAGEQVLRPGTAAGFPAGQQDGHCLINRTERDALYLEVGDRTPGDLPHYPDDDFGARYIDGKRVFTRKDGTPL
jgi:uncharacterized cupin superfamily protein